MAACSAIAGKLLTQGVSRNIIIQHTEKHGSTLGFFEFDLDGISLGFVNLLIYWLWFCYGYD
ncbi:hypothetical protein METHB2_10104 [Candidatus Methylobacter favarea]|uniref:Uncharacterized protein n=1 Tax=Candidatus Methylobacter favarea TaxID=2707345 RepID=A0A8S0W8G2_9GAMM|nr:hypothetical protein METHB2_10104 [Candidatus Methylobacter favarea]